MNIGCMSQESKQEGKGLESNKIKRLLQRIAIFTQRNRAFSSNPSTVPEPAAQKVRGAGMLAETPKRDGTPNRSPLLQVVITTGIRARDASFQLHKCLPWTQHEQGARKTWTRPRPNTQTQLLVKSMSAWLHSHIAYTSTKIRRSQSFQDVVNRAFPGRSLAIHQRYYAILALSAHQDKGTLDTASHEHTIPFATPLQDCKRQFTPSVWI